MLSGVIKDIVIPAQAGIQLAVDALRRQNWIPAFAGMTEIQTDALPNSAISPSNIQAESAMDFLPSSISGCFPTQPQGLSSNSCHSRKSVNPVLTAKNINSQLDSRLRGNDNALVTGYR